MKGLVYCQQVDGRMNCALLSVGDETATSSGQRGILIKYYNIYPAHAYYFYFIFVLIQFKL